MKKIKVLVVDDSLLFREFLVRAIDSDPMLDVVATAQDPFEARDAILKYRPDVMTLDIEMPRMNGIQFLKQLLPQYKLPVVMVSSLNEAVFDALAAGAVEFVNKPSSMSAQKITEFVENELAITIKAAAQSKIASKSGQYIDNKQIQSRNAVVNSKINLIAIGASTGGTEAILSVVDELNADVPGIVVVQHMPPGFTAMYAKRLDKKCVLSVKEAATGDIVKPGTVLIAPGDKHMTVYKDGANYKVKCAAGAKVSGHCPSVDVMFDSVAKNVGKSAMGIILTGMGADGVTGLAEMRRNGSETIGQDEASCVVYGMPKVAYECGAVKYQLPLSEIPKKIYHILRTQK